MSKDYYTILGVNKDATGDELKKAFRKKAHQYHPDKPGGDDKKFKEINEAYNTLSDVKKKKQYDTYGSAGASTGGGGQSGFGDFDFSGFEGQAGGGASSFGGFDFSDLFGGGFGGGNRVKRGRDIDVELEVSFKESIFGTKKTFSIKKDSECLSCEGSGAEKNSQLKTCSTCAGAGIVNEIRQTMMGSMQTQVECPDCLSKGKVPEKKCNSCDGSGIERRTEEVNIKIPSGIETGNRLRVSGKGQAVSGGESGDLYVHVKVSQSDRFKKMRDDVYADLDVSLTDAVLGANVKTSTVDGKITLKIPAGSQNGKVLKVKNEGVVISENKRGDLYIKLHVVVPTKISRKEKELFEEIRDL
jgi:molecular chaperone DnaJ